MLFRSKTHTKSVLFVAILISSCSSPEPEKKAVMDTVDQSTVATAGDKTPELPEAGGAAELKVVENATGGWGYDIYVDGKMSIHQPIIPGIPGNTPFKSKTDAETIGKLALEKFNQGNGLPTITIEELKNAGITN